MSYFKNTILLCCAFLLFGTSALQADSSSQKKSVLKKDDPQDSRERLLIFTPQGPIVIDVYITLNGLPFRMVSEKLAQEVLKQGDTDGDGKSTWAEAIKNPQFIVDLTRYQGKRAQPYLKVYDKNSNNIIELNEACGFIAMQAGGQLFKVAAVYSSTANINLKAMLDIDKNNILSKKELEQIQQVLSRNDSNNNDLIEQSEVSLSTNYRNRGVARGAPLPQIKTLFYLDKTKLATDLYDQFVKHYSPNEESIKKQDIPLLAAVWKSLDKDNNDLLDKNEVRYFHTIKPHFVFNVNLGIGKKTELLLEAKTNDFKNISIKKEKTSVYLKLPTLSLMLKVPNTTSNSTVNYFKQLAQRMIQQFDTDKNGYLEEKEIKKNQRGTYYLKSFKRWDVNTDGKVYADEIEASYNKTMAVRQSQVTLSTSHQKQMLFNLLDETGDGRLSLRELNVAKKRLLTLDKNHDGTLTANELPEMLTLTFNQGGRSNTGAGRAYSNGRYDSSTQQPSSKQQGPKWFIHMDKNGDGDLTPREFLGKPEMFKKLDSNQDGFIEKKEAEVASAK